MHNLYISVLFLLISSYAEGIITVGPENSCLQYLGRYNETESSDVKSFDSPGFQINFGVEGTSQIDILLSIANFDLPHRFWIYIDGILDGNIIDTKNATSGEVTSFNVAKNLSTDYHTVGLVKITEADWNNPFPTVNYLSFYGVELDTGDLKCLTDPHLSRKIEFIGDSITAGYCNLCKIDPTTSGYSAESFASSWPFLVSAGMEASYHTTGKSHAPPLLLL
jgi:hypothetical protein